MLLYPAHPLTPAWGRTARVTCQMCRTCGWTDALGVDGKRRRASRPWCPHREHRGPDSRGPGLANLRGLVRFPLSCLLPFMVADQDQVSGTTVWLAPMNSVPLSLPRARGGEWPGRRGFGSTPGIRGEGRGRRGPSATPSPLLGPPKVTDAGASRSLAKWAQCLLSGALQPLWGLSLPWGTQHVSPELPGFQKKPEFSIFT